MAVVGDKETAAGSVAVRSRSAGDLGPVSLEQFVERLSQEVASKA
jgi:threonyl-tRNA synthetase